MLKILIVMALSLLPVVQISRHVGFVLTCEKQGEGVKRKGNVTAVCFKFDTWTLVGQDRLTLLQTRSHLARRSYGVGIGRIDFQQPTVFTERFISHHSGHTHLLILSQRSWYRANDIFISQRCTILTPLVNGPVVERGRVYVDLDLSKAPWVYSRRSLLGQSHRIAHIRVPSIKSDAPEAAIRRAQKLLEELVSCANVVEDIAVRSFPLAMEVGDVLSVASSD